VTEHDDNGRRFNGHDAMRAWSDIEVASDGFNGYSRFAFEVDGDALRSMRITA
jgi:hypothetical protein